jgi:nucleoside 2-deoxyribosyltransferase
LKKIYIAGPLFTLAEKEFNIRFAETIKLKMKGIEVILPQERASKFSHLENGKALIFEDCLKMVSEADIVVAILDGADVDSGTSVELGYAFAVQTPIIGVRTDFRISEDRGLNLMLSNICNTLIIDVTSNMSSIVDSVIDAIAKYYSVDK